MMKDKRSGWIRKSEASDTGEPVGRPLKGSWVRAILPYAVMLVFLLIAIVITGHDIEHRIRAMESWIGNLGPWGIIAFIGLFVAATSLFVPESLLSALSGALFGVIPGLMVSLAGNLLSAALQYFLSRFLLRHRIDRAFGKRPAFAAIQQAIHRDAFRLQVLLRLTPMSPAALSYLLGAAGVRFATFLPACLALIPYLVVEVFFGHAGRHIAGIAGRTTPAIYLRDLVSVGILIVSVIVVLLLSRVAKKAVVDAMAQTKEPVGSV